MSILRVSILILICLSAVPPAEAQSVPFFRHAPTADTVAQEPADAPPMTSPPASGPSGSTANDDDPIGRKFVTPPELPPTPAGTEALIQKPTAADEADGGLTLDALLSMACQNNPTLLQARMQVSGTLGKALQAGLWPNPVFNYVGEQIGVMGTPGEFQGGILEQEIVTAHKRKISREKYLQRARVAELKAKRARKAG